MEDSPFIRFFKIAIFSSLGLMAGVFLFYAVEKGWTLHLIGLGLFMVIAALTVMVLRQKKIIETMEGSQGGFVMDTFQDVVGKLKKDEKELEKSKSYAEEKAERVEAYNENILQSVPSGVISIDNVLKIKSINQAAEHILGIKVEEVIGRAFGDVFDGPLADLVKEEKNVSRGEYQYITSDKKHLCLGITTSQLKNVSNEKIGLIFVFTDLTGIKNLQAQIELKQRLSQLGEMSAGISHELRNSMSVISGYARLLGKKADPSVKPTVDAITAEVISMDKIISELLAFAKPTVLSLENIDLNKMIEEMVRSVIAGNEAVKISLNAGPHILMNADEVLLRQAFLNLIINAVESMPDGGSIDIKLDRVHDRVKISISDTGSGIPRDILQKIFLPFYTTKDEGTGLGLALVQKIIISHGGTIEVKNREGNGMVFIVLLPV